MGGSTKDRLAKWATKRLDRTSVRARQVAVEVAAEFRKHPVAAIAFGLLCLGVYPRQTVELLLLAGAVLGAALYSQFWLWAQRWKAALLAADRDIPTQKELHTTYKRLQQREKKLLTDWPGLCTMHGLHANKRTPLLLNVAPTIDEDFQAFIPRTGFDPDDIKTKAVKIAKGLGCEGIVVRETAVGCAEVKFNWSNPIRRELPLRELKMPTQGGIAFGHSETGEPAELRVDASKVFVGVMGSGKSNGAEAALADLVRRREYVRLFVSNPKRNEMKAFNQFVGQSMGRLQVRAYAESAADNEAMIKQFVHAMDVRAGMMKGRKLTKTSADNPLCILWLDEMMMLPKTTYKDGPYSPLGQACIAGRASLYVTWGCTQMFYAADFGSLRGLFDERVLFRVKTDDQADMVIEHASRRGALAHRIHPTKERGVGYLEDQHGELTKFRAAKVEDADLQRIIRGQTPHGMITEVDGQRRCAVYEILGFPAEDGARELKYIGEAFEPLERLQEHIADPKEPWWATVDDPLNECDPTTFKWKWYDSKALAVARQNERIAAEGPTKNYIKNTRNPMRHARDWMAQRQIDVESRRVSGPDFLPWLPADAGKSWAA